MVVNLGPTSPTLQEPEDVAVNGGAYNPRCLKRDISPWVSQQWSTDQQSVDLITNYTDISNFQTTMQGDFAAGFYGVHTVRRFSLFTVSHRYLPFLNISSRFLNCIPNFPLSSKFKKYKRLTQIIPGRTLHLRRRPRRRPLLLSRRPSFLATPRTNRSHVVDLAEPRPDEPRQGDRGHDNAEQQPAQRERHAEG
jgi:Common central domain of tyrosinase